MLRTAELGTDFWNDSCDLRELGEAVQEGAVGATSNPVIVHQVVAGDAATWTPVLDALIREHTDAMEDDIAWMLIGAIGERAAALLAPVHAHTERRKGYLSMQVNPKLYRNTARMVAHARELSRTATNVAIKLPATAAGIAAMEQLTAEGIRINATVCFCVPQAIACATAVERGLDAARAAGRDISTLLPTITIMIGRIDDHLRRVTEASKLQIDPEHLNWAGIAIFKRAHALFIEGGFRSTLLAAAYRCPLHWTELIGERVIQTMPYAWWTRFNASETTPERSIDRPVDAGIMATLRRFEDFDRAYDPTGMSIDEFTGFGATVHTLQQFLGGYQKLVELVRTRMLS
jgi:transaldolase